MNVASEIQSRLGDGTIATSDVATQLAHAASSEIRESQSEAHRAVLYAFAFLMMRLSYDHDRLLLADEKDAFLRVARKPFRDVALFLEDGGSADAAIRIISSLAAIDQTHLAPL